MAQAAQNWMDPYTTGSHPGERHCGIFPATGQVDYTKVLYSPPHCDILSFPHFLVSPASVVSDFIGKDRLLGHFPVAKG